MLATCLGKALYRGYAGTVAIQRSIQFLVFIDKCRSAHLLQGLYIQFVIYFSRCIIHTIMWCIYSQFVMSFQICTVPKVNLFTRDCNSLSHTSE